MDNQKTIVRDFSFVMSFGKHKGKQLNSIIGTDLQYIMWLVDANVFEFINVDVLRYNLNKIADEQASSPLLRYKPCRRRLGRVESAWDEEDPDHENFGTIDNN